MVKDGEDFDNLKVNVGWVNVAQICDEDERRLYEQNCKSFDAIRDLFSTEPIGTKVCVRCVSGGSEGMRYKVESNPIGMPDDLIALYCDSGNLAFGYHRDGGYIVIHTS